jgi:hypothetical protein
LPGTATELESKRRLPDGTGTLPGKLAGTGKQRNSFKFKKNKRNTKQKRPKTRSQAEVPTNEWDDVFEPTTTETYEDDLEDPKVQIKEEEIVPFHLDVDDEEPSDEDEDMPTSKPGGIKLKRELRGLNVKPAASVSRELRGLYTNYNKTYDEILSAMEVHSAITSDPGEPTTMKQALQSPESAKWMEAIKKEINNFLDRKVWKSVNRQEVSKKIKEEIHHYKVDI